VIRRWLSLIAVRAALRAIGRVLRIAIIAALIIAAAPASVVAAIGAVLAWLRGWPPVRLYRAALWCLPMLAVWLAATAIASRSGSAAAAAPYHAWLTLWHSTNPASAADIAAIAPLAIPAGLAVGGLAWAYRIRSMRTATAGLSPDAAVSFDLRQWRHQARSARARIAAPGAIPLTTRNGSLVAGAVIRRVNHPGGPIASIPYSRMRSHQVVIGTTGTGKTTLLLRLWAGFMATALRRHAAGQGRLPLLVVLDCKGGADARRIADRARRAMRLAGARSTAIWPDEASLSLWALPPAQLTTTLVDLIEHGTGAAAFYADVMEAVVALAVEAPGGPPASAADFLAPAASATPTPGTASSRAPPRSAWPRRRPARSSTSWPATPRPAARTGRSCSRSTSSAPCPDLQAGPMVATGRGGRPVQALPAGRHLWARVRQGRPARLALRILIAVAAAAAAALAAGPHPAAPALVTGVATWLVLTARHDLAPPDRH
jgi:hypothetical protein